MKKDELLRMGMYPLTEATQEKFDMMKELSPFRFPMFETIEEIREVIEKQGLPEEDLYLSTGLYDLVLFDGRWGFMDYHNFTEMNLAETWKTFKERMVHLENQKKYASLLVFVPKSHKKVIIEQHLDEIPEIDRRKLLIDIRTSSEYQFQEFDEETFVPQMLKSKEGAEDLKQLKDLHPELVLTIFRGQTPKSTELEHALSWTTDIQYAEYFANRFSSEGVIYQARVKRDQVLAYTDREAEVLVQYDDLMDVCEIPMSADIKALKR